MLTVSIRAVILYLISIIAMRLMGKRQVGQLQPYEFVLAIMIADLAASPMENVGTPLLYGIVPILTLLFLHALFTLLNVNSISVRRALCGGPSVMIRRGVLQYDEMRRMNYSLSDLLEEMRSQGYLNIAQVDTAILETGGKLSVFPRAPYAPLTPEDIHLRTQREGVPLTLILDGRIQEGHLALCGKDVVWLMEQLQKAGVQHEEAVLLASLDTRGKLYVQLKNDAENAMLFQALDAKEVSW